jgi:hypothetical protein
MEDADEEAAMDRLGLDVRTRDILGVALREVTLLVRPGRSASAIVEMAARNELLRVTGKDSSRELVRRIDRGIAGRMAGESGMMPAVTPESSNGFRIRSIRGVSTDFPPMKSVVRCIAIPGILQRGCSCAEYRSGKKKCGHSATPDRFVTDFGWTGPANEA